MSEQVIVIGGGGHAKVVMDCIQTAGDTVVGILDDLLEKSQLVLGVPVLGTIKEYTQYIDKKFIIAIGNNQIRHRIAESLPVAWYTAVHPHATVSSHATIGAGSVVMARTVIQAEAVIGCHCIINSGAIVEHDNVLSDFVHISPGAMLGGTVTIGADTHVGIGAVIKNNIAICSGCVIGAGAVVVKNITESGVYVGVPAHYR